MKNETKHTPGPWIVSEHKAHNGCFQIKSFSKFEHRAFLVTETPSWDGVEDKANARLIAAAPDLYEAVQGLMLWLMDDAIEAEKNGRKIGAYESARAALAKARGE